MQIVLCTWHVILIGQINQKPRLVISQQYISLMSLESENYISEMMRSALNL